MVLRIYRLANWLVRHRVPLLPRCLYVLNRVLFAVVLPPTAELGRSVRLGYAGLGIVIHHRCRIGDGVVIGPKVTLGGRSGLYGVPVIGDGVEIGAGAAVLGPVTVGRLAKIGAGAVVLSDVPEGAVMVGVPARMVGTVEPASRR